MNTQRAEGESAIKFFFKNVAAASTAACIAEIATIPVDTAKVRLQVQGKSATPGVAPKYSGFLGTMKTIAAEEGPFALYNGLSAGLQRQIVFAGLRIGLYVPVRTAIAGELKPGEAPSLRTKILAAMCTGTIGISVANPTDVVKVKMQTQARSSDPTMKKYKGSIDCYRQVYAADGLAGLWVGIIPNILRNSVINAAEIASYDQYKEMWLKYTSIPDKLGLHFICAAMAGFTAAVFGSPFDVVKTRMMSAQVPYKGVVDCVGKTLVNEGPLAFYKGFSANAMRIVSWNIVMFISLEQIKKVLFPPLKKE
jgi:solute carrier family 25 (mitochondrial uncoupling protein), member 8/9